MKTNEQLSRLTVLIALKDNPRRTRHLIKNGFHPSLKYLIADGSLGDENEKLFQSINDENVEYFRYPPDETLKAFVHKMSDASSRVRTEFVVMQDPGDYLRPNAVATAVDQFGKGITDSCVSGRSVFVRETCGLMTPPRIAASAEHLDGKPITSALDAIHDRYSHIWYAVFRREVLAKAWDLAAKLAPEHPLLEYLPTLVALKSGTIRHCETITHVRVVHGPSQWTEQSSDLNASSTNGLEELTAFAEIISVELGGQSSEAILEAFTPNSRRVSQQTTRTASAQKLSRRLSDFKVPKTLSRYLSMNALSHYIGYWVRPKPDRRNGIPVEFTFDLLRMRPSASVLKSL